MYTKPDSPLSIGGVLDDGFRLLKASFSNVIGLALVSGLLGQMPSMALPTAEAGEMPEFSGTFLTLTLLMAPLSLIFFCAIVARINAVANGTTLSIGDALQVGLRRFLPLFLCGILFSIAIVGGMIALIVPGIILMVSLGFSVYLVVTDNLGPLEAIKTSHKLVWGNWWRTLVLTSVVLFIIFTVTLLLGLVSGVLEATLGVPEIIALLLFALLYAVVYPVVYALYMAILNDLKLRKQGDDLAVRIDTVNTPEG